MRFLLRIMCGICIFPGFLFLLLAMFGLMQQLVTAGETKTVGSGEFATTMPKTTVFQEIDVIVFGVLGATMIGAGAGCECAVQMIAMKSEVTSGIKRLENKTAMPPIVTVQPTRIDNADSAAAEWFGHDDAKPVAEWSNQPKPVADDKVKTKCEACGKSVKGGKDWAGRKGTCPYCKAAIKFPELSLVG